MIANILKSVVKNFQTFLVIWVVTIIVNQLFIFGACFAPYCLIVALPHTSIIAALITYFSSEEETLDSKKKTTEYTQNDLEVDLNDFEEAQVPFCPKCGSKMLLRTAKNGKFAGRNFWGCSKYPECNSILNV